MDPFIFRFLSDTAAMVRVLGCKTVMTGIRSECAAVLAQMDSEPEGDVHFESSVEEGLELIEGK